MFLYTLSAPLIPSKPACGSTSLNMSRQSFIDSLASLSTDTAHSPAPSYTTKPQADERTLDETPFLGRSPTGVYEQVAGPLTLRLHRQVDGISKPAIYSRQHVSGELLVRSEECSGMMRISLKLEGTLSLDLDEGIKEKHQLLEETHVLWRLSQDGPSPGALVSFDIAVPAEFIGKDDQRRPLPPVCHFAFPSPASLRARVEYNLTFTVERRRKHNMLSRNRTITTSFDYVRRTQPHRPMTGASPGSLTSLIDWAEHMSRIPARGQSLPPLDLRVFIPASKVYWVGDTIPFRLRVSGLTSALIELFGDESYSDMAPERHGDAASITVKLMRQVAIRVRKMPGHREMVLGAATVRRMPLPPAHEEGSFSEYGVMHWEGEVRIGQPDTVPGFDAGALLVKDFIVVEIMPPTSDPARFALPHRLPVFVRFTTDRHEGAGPG
ncbi:hypothetical protein BD626DRAFT_490271 [Schizophyllum amplum]|uniref:Arrestin-like N-terminal domain-containing protein n=1 Tax=Schizophyllum amplum TaxID=97359 RepID=A0A550CJ90_9AGAR|nr:hypothetical protein BD626DRAFT_490271 [Auriculariopsis ampla]